MTADTGRFLTMAGEFLRADPARNSVMLTVTENLRVSAAAPAAGPPALRLVATGRGPGRRRVHAHAGFPSHALPGERAGRGAARQ